MVFFLFQKSTFVINENNITQNWISKHHNITPHKWNFKNHTICFFFFCSSEIGLINAWKHHVFTLETNNLSKFKTSRFWVFRKTMRMKRLMMFWIILPWWKKKNVMFFELYNILACKRKNLMFLMKHLCFFLHFKNRQLW